MAHGLQWVCIIHSHSDQFVSVCAGGITLNLVNQFKGDIFQAKPTHGLR